MAKLLGEFEQLVLFSVLSLKTDAYGAQIVRFISDRTSRNVSIGAVGTALDRLEVKGLVNSEICEPTPERGGRRKRLFELTKTGAVELQESYDRIQKISQGVIAELRETAR